MVSILDWLHRTNMLPGRRMDFVSGGTGRKELRDVAVAPGTLFCRRTGARLLDATVADLDARNVGLALALGDLELGETLGAMMGALAHDETGIADLEADVFEYIEGSAGRTEMIRTVHASLGAALSRMPRPR